MPLPPKNNCPDFQGLRLIWLITRLKFPIKTIVSFKISLQIENNPKYILVTFYKSVWNYLCWQLMHKCELDGPLGNNINRSFFVNTPNIHFLKHQFYVRIKDLNRGFATHSHQISYIFSIDTPRCIWQKDTKYLIMS